MKIKQDEIRQEINSVNHSELHNGAVRGLGLEEPCCRIQINTLFKFDWHQCSITKLNGNQSKLYTFYQKFMQNSQHESIH